MKRNLNEKRVNICFYKNTKPQSVPRNGSRLSTQNNLTSTKKRFNINQTCFDM